MPIIGDFILFSSIPLLTSISVMVNAGITPDFAIVLYDTAKSKEGAAYFESG